MKKPLDDDDDVEMETPEKEKVQVVEEEDLGVGQVPAEVTDIDVVEDQCNPQLCVEYASAIYSYLRRVEDGLSIKEDFLRGWVFLLFVSDVDKYHGKLLVSKLLRIIFWGFCMRGENFGSEVGKINTVCIIVSLCP